MNLPEAVQIPYSTYQNLLEHLQVHAPTDGWAASLLQQLQQEAEPVSNQSWWEKVVDSYQCVYSFIME